MPRSEARSPLHLSCLRSTTNPGIQKSSLQSPTMADNDVATKAPESDAQEGTEQPSEAEKISGIPGDTKPDQGSASMGVSANPRRLGCELLN